MVDAYTVRLSEVPTADDERRHEVECVLDYEPFGDLIGVEIIGLKNQIGFNPFEATDQRFLTSHPHMSFSYDPDCDCSYLRLAKGSPRDQRSTRCVIVTDAHGKPLRMEIG